MERYIEKLTADAKMKELLIEPIKRTRDEACYEESDYLKRKLSQALPKDLAKHIVEKSVTRKNAHKKIHDMLHAVSEQERRSLDLTRTRIIKKLDLD